ncbi:SabA family sialic acid-binding adhesin, partial [Helicobacter pylori]|uniref:Hop family adhesin SabA n=1 Tax=Helicobacter pylori TaxID=210 RepID=UPI002DD7EF36
MKKRFLLSLSLSLAVPSLHAEDNGFFIGAGYQIGEAVQMVKNTGELKNLNDKYEQLSQYLNQVASLKQSIQTANNSQAVNNALSDLKSFASNNHTNKETSPIYNTTQAVITSVLAFWSLYAGNALSFFVNDLNDGSNSPLTRINQDGNCTGLQKCFMSRETYDKMKALAENLQKAQGNLCALSEQCSSNQSSGNKTSITTALETAQQLMDLIEQAKVSMVWKNIVIAGVSNVSGGAITSTNYPTQYAVFNNIKAMIPILQQAVTLSQSNHTLSASLQAQATGTQTNPNFAKDIYAFAQNQKQIISYAQDIFNLFSSIPKDQYNYLEKAYLKIPNAGSTPTNPYRQEVNLNQEIQTIQNNVSYYGNRIDSA